MEQWVIGKKNYSLIFLKLVIPELHASNIPGGANPRSSSIIG